MPSKLHCRGAFSLAVATILLLAAGCSAKSAEPHLKAQKADHIVIVKSNHTMTLLASGYVLKVYKVALGRGGAGPKEREGDHKTPEGHYVIDWKNQHSRFHLALHISYPNASDRMRARKAGVNPGGDIMIHGVERNFAWLGSLQHDVDWTDGCVAVTNREMDEVWKLVPVGTPVDIKP